MPDKKTELCLAGVDYGSKMAGTTVFAYTKGNALWLLQSEKGKDADAFLQKLIRMHQPHYLGFDAPLSLPGVYLKIPGCTDYFYRAADRALGAMSPMFLGGLTARAMRIKHECSDLDTQIFETYPARLVGKLCPGLKGYKKSSEALKVFKDAFSETMQLQVKELNNWHQADALLALWAAWRKNLEIADVYGNPHEGLIYI
ncbi:MAG: hypothetical protein JJU28_24050 [Cyclobacteriaceae bacterium]|nr:hypothetical protein [Cyclobacteriaceae bacterium]